MKVRVLFFGVLADRLGRRELDVVLSNGATAAELAAKLAADYPDVAAMRDKIALAVNMEYAVGAQMLEEDDEVAVIPPVSGG